MDLKFNKIIIAGAGGVGFWLTIALCRTLRGTIPIEVYDPDTFEGGQGYLRLPRADSSRYKVNVLESFIASSFIMRDYPPTTYRRRLTPEDFRGWDRRDTLVVDCTDMDQEPREALWEVIRHSGATGIRVSYDGLGIATISPGPPMMTGDATDGGYNIVPNLAQSFGAAGLGAQAVLYTLYTGKVLEFQTFVPTYKTESIELERRSDSDANTDSHSRELPNSPEV